MSFCAMFAYPPSSSTTTTPSSADVHVPITPLLRAAIADTISRPTAGADADALAALAKLQNSGATQLATRGELASVTASLRRCGCRTPLQELLRTATLRFPAKPSAQPSATLLQRREYLQRRADAAAYNKMVAGVGTKKDDPSERVGALLPGLSVGADMIVAMVSVFIICFMAASTMGFDYGWRLAAGLLGGCVLRLGMWVCAYFRPFFGQKPTKPPPIPCSGSGSCLLR